MANPIFLNTPYSFKLNVCFVTIPFIAFQNKYSNYASICNNIILKNRKNTHQDIYTFRNIHYFVSIDLEFNQNKQLLFKKK